MAEQIMEDFRRATSARADVLAEEQDVLECLRSLMDDASVEKDADVPVLRYYTSYARGSASWDAAAWIIQEEAEARGWSGYYLRIGEDLGDKESVYWGNDKKLYENLGWIAPFVRPKWCVPALVMDRYDLMKIAGQQGLGDEDIHRLVSAVLPEVENLVRRKAAELDLAPWHVAGN